jgi:hypothetical protein
MKLHTRLFAALLLCAAGGLAVQHHIGTGPLRVLVLTNASQVVPAQSLLIDLEVRGYLDAHCERDKGVSAHRCLAADDSMEAETPQWQALAAKLKAKCDGKPLPWIAVEVSGQSVCVPASLEKVWFLKTLRLYGGL